MSASLDGVRARVLSDDPVGTSSCSACSEEALCTEMGLGRIVEVADGGPSGWRFVVLRVARVWDEELMVVRAGRSRWPFRELAGGLRPRLLASSETLMGGGRFFRVGVGMEASESLEGWASLSWRWPLGVTDPPRLEVRLARIW